MENKKTAKRKNGGVFLLIFVGVYFAIQFKDLETTNSLIGMIACVFIIGLGFYSLYRSSNKAS
jgi:ABC-type nickel/cobalt efflux system permease component RcnA